MTQSAINRLPMRPAAALRPTRPAIQETLRCGQVIHSATVCGIYVESTNRAAVESVLAAQEIAETLSKNGARP